MKNLLNFMLCFSILLFVSNGVNATEDHSPPGIELKCDAPEGMSVEIFILKAYKSNTIEPAIIPVMILESKINKGGLFALQLWPVAEKCIINNKITGFDNSLYALNHLLYEAKCLNDYKTINNHGVYGLEIVYNQSFLQS